MGFRDVVLGIDFHDAFQAVSDTQTWPRYRHLLAKINDLRSGFSLVVFEHESASTNFIARDCTKCNSAWEVPLLPRPWRPCLAPQ